MISVKTRNILLGALLSLLLAFGYGWYVGHQKAEKVAQTALNEVKNELTRITVLLDDKEYYITKVEQEILTLKEAKKQGEVDNQTLKKLNIKHLAELTKAKLLIDTLLKQVSHDGKVVVVHDTAWVDYQNAIIIPFTFTKKDQWMTLVGDFDEDAKLDIDLRMNIPIDLYVGTDKKTKAPVATLTTPNPYVSTLSLSSQKYDVVKPLRYGLGVQVGYGITNKGLSPYVGVGISYNIIRF